MVDTIIIWIRDNQKKAITLFVLHFPVFAFYGHMLIKFNYTGKMILDTNHIGYAILSYFAAIFSLPFTIIISVSAFMLAWMAFKIIHIIVTGIYFMNKYGNVYKLINRIICSIDIDSVKIYLYKYREYDEVDYYSIDEDEDCPSKHIVEYGYRITGIPSSKIPYMNEFLYRKFKFELLIKLNCVIEYSINEHIINDAIDIVSDGSKTLGGVRWVKELQKKVLHSYSQVSKQGFATFASLARKH